MNNTLSHDKPAPAQDTASSIAANASNLATSIADKAKTSLSDFGDSAASATRQARDVAGHMASDAVHGFKDAVETHKASGADAIASVARSAREAADGFEKQSPQVARMVRTAADSVERVSSDLRDKSVNELMASVSDFAHRQPKLFFGCGIVAGLVLSRLLRGSSDA